MYNLAFEVQTAIEHILKTDKNNNQNILLIGRYNFDGERLGNTSLFDYDDYSKKITCKKYPRINLEFMTAHKSKGLGYDNVIIINGRNETWGFPSKIEDDVILKLVTKTDNNIEYAEERRLFYVALTRTKNRVFIIVPKEKPSEFVLELLYNYRDIEVVGEISPTENSCLLTNKLCPICGYPLQRRKNKNFGLDLWICSNEPELCGFMTNNLGGGTTPIKKCPCCVDGYLIIKKSCSDNLFLGCTNYSKDNAGCDFTTPLDEITQCNDEKSSIFVYANDYAASFIDENEEIYDEEFVCSRKDNRSSVKYECETIKQKKEKESVTENSSKENYETRDLPKEDNEEISNEILQELLEVVTNIFLCLKEVEQIRSFGVTTTINILSGSQSQKIYKYGLDDLKSYNSLAGYSISYIQDIIDCLIKNDYIEKTEGIYSVIRSSGKGVKFNSRIDADLLISLFKHLDHYYQESEACVQDIDKDCEELFESLRRLRNSMASELRMKPFYIFTNESLKLMAIKKPTTEEIFLEIKGVGTKKIIKYGKQFINHINYYLSKHDVK